MSPELSQTKTLVDSATQAACRAAERLCSIVLRGAALGVCLLAGAALAQVPGPVSFQGSGGTISGQGPYTVHVFTANGSFTPPPGVSAVDVLVVAGGGGGGAGDNSGGGGGGAGGLLWTLAHGIGSGPIAVTVGAGGAGGNGTDGGTGANSEFAGIVAFGGGYGQAGQSGSASSSGGNGGSGGGGGARQSNGIPQPGGLGSAGQGQNGGESNNSGGNNNRSGGGGGGAGGAGGAGQNNSGGDGGIGQNFSAIFGTSVGDNGWFAGGGGGSKRNQNSGGTGGAGGGADGVTGWTTGISAQPNTGGGGGGGGRDRDGGAGGSGVVILRYQAPTLSIVQQPSSTTLSGEVFAQSAIVEMLDGAGSPLANVSISATLGSGAGTLGGTLTRSTDANGQADFSDLQISGPVGDRRVRFSPAGSTGFVESNTVTVTSYHLEISHIAAQGLCVSNTAVTLSVLDSNSNPVTDFSGTVTITNSLGLGNYTLNSGAPARFSNLAANDGIAQYEFLPADAGTVVLNFIAPSIGTYSFDANSGSLATENYAGGLVVSACSFRISHDGAGNVCSRDPITIGVYANNALVTGYTGNVNLSTAGATGGNWFKTATPGAALGSLNNGAANDGAATYAFVSGDGGQIVLDFQDNTAETVNFNVTAPGVSAPNGIYDPNFTVSACTFRVTHSEAMDVCTPEDVTITLVDSAGATVTDYTGTVNLSTTSGRGTWRKTGVAADAEGTLVDPIDGDGGATYQFASADAGTITLRFTHPGADGVVNINVTDGATSDPGDSANAYDRTITVDLCKIEISHSESSTACEIEAVTFSIRNSVGVLAVDYEGTITLATNTLHGNWSINTGAGTLTDSAGDDNGAATYAFHASDDGVVVLDFSSPHAETVNFDASATGIIVDAAFDPDLVVGSCLPALAGAVSCVNGNSTSVSIPMQAPTPSQRGRMVLMLISGTSLNNVSSATFGGQPMSLIGRRSASGDGSQSSTEMWGILDADLPVTSGFYTGSFTGGAPVERGMCLVVVDGVAQSFPLATSPADTGPLNSSSGAGARTTTITTTANNSLVVAATTFKGSWWQSAGTPVPDYLTRVFGDGSPLADPTTSGRFQTTARFLGALGRAPSAGIENISEELGAAWGGATQLGTQVVAAFEPLTSGPPVASNYVPVTLEQTYSGNMSYRAIGATLRSSFASSNQAACEFVNFTTGAAATLGMPAGANVTAAHLYWGGSGDDALGQTDSDVMFGLTGSEAPISADKIYLVTNPSATNVSYFAGYKDVTALVAGSGSYTLKDLVVQNGAPWNASQACAGGWGLVVAYEHPDERLRVMNLFQGFQPFQYLSFTLVPRNFRMATNDPVQNLPNGQVTHITLEGDETLPAPGSTDQEEGLWLQSAPNSTSFTRMVSSFNPIGQEFNSTVTRPTYIYSPVTEYYEFDATAGPNGDGYMIDEPGPDATTGGPRFGNTWGFDVDTHYVNGGNPGTLLYEFAKPGEEAERITTRYSAGQDLVMLISEVISVTNYPVADIEVNISETSTFKVNGSGTYQVDVINNGDGGIDGGYADGEILVAGQLPTGMTFANAGAVVGSGWSCSVTLDPGAYSCVYDITSTWTGGAVAGQLGSGESLPPIALTVQLAGSTTFPLRTNSAKNSVRVLHSDGSCPATSNGVIPDADDCLRSPQFDNVNDLGGGTIDINDLEDKQTNNNNVASVITVVRGVEVDLQIMKSVEDILESGSTGVYTLQVTNNGPDATTAPITVNDTQPTGVLFQSAGGTGWSCPTPPGNLSCTYAGSLGVGQTSTILLTVDVTGSDGDYVTNVASVSPGPFNFDVNDTNDSSTNVTQISGAPVATQERFLMSVSSLGATTSIGGLSGIEDDDYFIYDPATDTATMFFDNSVLGFNVNDADAVHVLKNGHIVISAKSASSIGAGSNLLNFEPGDLVVYDPILGTTSMLFDGSAIFGGPNPEGNNITAVYVNDDGSIDMAVTAAGPASTVGTNGLSIDNNSIVRYHPNGSAQVFRDVASYLDGGGADDSAIVTGYYRRVDPNNPDATVDTDIFTFHDSADDLVNTGAGAGNDPVGGTYASQDDVTQIDLVGGVSTENLFLGNVEQGVFASTGNTSDLLIDALHVLEDGYIGHFRISEVGGDASVCSPAGLQLRISKHMGLSHMRDTDYVGSIRVTADSGAGNWTLVSGSGTVSNGLANDGIATYTFVPGDAGSVVLSLTQANAGTVKVQVSNGIAREGHPPGVGAEAPSFTYTQGVALGYLDNFSTVSYANQNGTHAWATNWQEGDDAPGGAGAATGNVRVSAGKARFSRAYGTSNASLTRSIDLGGATLNAPLMLSFSYDFSQLDANDEFVVEASIDGLSWTLLRTYKRGSTLANIANGNGLSGNLNLSSALASTLSGENVQIRFRISSGYVTGGSFAIDNVKLITETSNCDVSPLGINHYAISINGVTSGVAHGVACVGAEVQITAHDGAHSPLPPGPVTISLSTSTSRGNWSRIIAGSGGLNNGSINDGVATYTFPSNENSVTLRFDYTGPLSDPEVVNIDVTDTTSTELSPAEDPNYSVSQVGLRFLDSVTSETVTPIPTQIAGKPSNVNPDASLLYVQVVNTSDTNPSVCEPLFAVGQTLELGFAAQCDDPTQCVTATENFAVNGTDVALLDKTGPINYTTVQTTLSDVGGGVPGAPIVINYSDVGKMYLLTSFEFPFGDDSDPLLASKSGDTVTAISNRFVVRPFGFDIDFSDGRANNGNADASYAADHNASLWKIAGESFDTTVSAVAWAAGDDSNNDGVPDPGADLSDNHVTPNFDVDSASGDYSVKLSIIENKVPGGIDGELSNDDFDNFSFGVDTHSIVYNEVGIIDLRADIVNASDVVIPYLGTANVEGRVLNVGRFYPNLFSVTRSALTGRADAACTPDSTFTYMDEPFQIELELVAKGLTDSGNYTTMNYRGDYAKLNLFGELALVAIDDIDAADDVDYSSRLSNSSLPVSFAATWTNGVLALSGNMIFQRNTPAAPDGPFPDMQIAFKPVDDDGVTIDPARIDELTPLGILNVDLDTLATEPGTNVYYLIDEHEFRYGRLIVNNAYGPETEDLALTFLVEYFNGSEFVRNVLDNCSVIDVSDLSFVSGS